MQAFLLETVIELIFVVSCITIQCCNVLLHKPIPRRNYQTIELKTLDFGDFHAENGERLHRVPKYKV